MVSHGTSRSLGIRVRNDAFQIVSDADSTRTGVYWFDLRTRYPFGACVKRGIDLVVAATLIAMLSPLILFAIAIIRLSAPGSPAISAQRRIGFRCREFMMYGFRTTAEDQRLTVTGHVLRRFGLDALPQLFNVLEGDMSLVGPKALFADELDDFPARSQMRRFSVLPGMTGLWRVSGRDLNADQRLTLDREYVNKWSLRRDLAILFRTTGVRFHRSQRN